MSILRNRFIAPGYCLFLAITAGYAQAPEPFPATAGDSYEASAAHPCVSEELYQTIESEIVQNRKRLGLEITDQRQAFSTQLQWPLQPASELKDCGYYYISAYVDQNTASSSIQDWNCGTRTYDGHRGTDIVGWPFIWNKMDNNLVRVIAAAPGTIIAKADGNPDRVCDGVGGGSSSNNYIIVQHADGSTALYIHLKSGSFTTKAIGQTVTAGEYLGIVGSAGQSTGAHLHFEIRSDGTFAHYIDPYAGACNSGITSTWWAAQKPYEEPAILKLSLHTSWPYMGVCPNTTDTLYESDNFASAPGTKATFYVCSRDVAANAGWSFQVLSPTSAVVDSWSFTNGPTPRKASTLGWTRTLPTTPGRYTFKGTFNGQTCTKTFDISSLTPVINQQESEHIVQVYPNPARDMIYFKIQDKTGAAIYCRLIDPAGRQAAAFELAGPVFEYSVAGLPAGVYFYEILTDGQQLRIGKLCIGL